MLFAGFFVNQDNIPEFLYPFKYISLFKYGMQAFIQNEYSDANLKKFDCYMSKPKTCDPLTEYNSPEGLWLSIGLIWAVGAGFYILSYFVLLLFSKRYS